MDRRAPTDSWREGLVLIGVVLVAILVGTLPAVKHTHALVETWRHSLEPIALAVAAAGVVALLMSFASAGASRGRPMTKEEFEQLSARTQILSPAPWRSRTRFRGRFAGVVAKDAWTFRDMKTSWRSGDWWRHGDARRMFLATVGGLGLFFGGFSFLFLKSAASIQLLIGAVLVYAAARLVVAFGRA